MFRPIDLPHAHASIHILVCMALSGLFVTTGARAQQMERVVDLRGMWKFELGDDPGRAETAFDDSGWEQIRVPSAWEDQGFPGYDGFAWYRRTFTISAAHRNTPLYLVLGYIDDVDEVFVNGRFLGFQGRFPPSYLTAYNIERRYYLPAEMLRFDAPNTIAVRVYDSELAGGMLRGDVGMYRDRDFIYPDLSLTGRWKFRTGDDRNWRTPWYDDSKWETALIPAYWETQGWPGYDGIAWYRRTITIPERLRSQQLILLLGRIDDMDEAWVNGIPLGRTGRIPSSTGPHFGTEYETLRAYTIPPSAIRADGALVIAVRVYDGFMHGGIYDGPVGLITRERFRSRPASRGPLDGLERLMERIFGK